MSNTIKFCGCRACKAGRHHPNNKVNTRKSLRAFRRNTKQALKRGVEPPTKISIDFTD